MKKIPSKDVARELDVLYHMTVAQIALIIRYGEHENERAALAGVAESIHATAANLDIKLTKYNWLRGS